MCGAGDKDGAGGIVWLERGEERPFGPLEEVRRPWLEESAAWGQPDAPDQGGDDGGGGGDDGPALVWL